MPIPTSLSKRKQEEILGQPHTKLPDLDNLCKLILDCAQGPLFENDSIISAISTRKIYDKKPRTELTITKMVMYDEEN